MGFKDIIWILAMGWGVIWGIKGTIRRSKQVKTNRILWNASRYLTQSRLKFASVQDRGILPEGDISAIDLLNSLMYRDVL